MGLSIRFYLWAEDGAKRITARQSDQLERGEIALPQYASTTQKYVEAIIENDRRRAVLRYARGYYRSFDERGSSPAAMSSTEPPSRWSERS
jgi:hypothetical protein